MCEHYRYHGSNECLYCGESAEPRDDRLPVFDSSTSRCKFLGAYRVWLAYGGPEEGGWWQTMQEHVASVMVRDGDDLQAVARALWDSFAEEDDGCRVSDSNATCAICVYREEAPGDQAVLSVGRYE